MYSGNVRLFCTADASRYLSLPSLLFVIVVVMYSGILLAQTHNNHNGIHTHTHTHTDNRTAVLFVVYRNPCDGLRSTRRFSQTFFVVPYRGYDYTAKTKNKHYKTIYESVTYGRVWFAFRFYVHCADRTPTHSGKGMDFYRDRNEFDNDEIEMSPGKYLFIISCLSWNECLSHPSCF